MSNVSLNLPDELKRQIANAARELGISPHAFMVEAISRATSAVEQKKLLALIRTRPPVSE